MISAVAVGIHGLQFRCPSPVSAARQLEDELQRRNTSRYDPRTKRRSERGGGGGGGGERKRRGGGWEKGEDEGRRTGMHQMKKTMYPSINARLGYEWKEGGGGEKGRRRKRPQRKEWQQRERTEVMEKEIKVMQSFLEQCRTVSLANQLECVEFSKDYKGKKDERNERALIENEEGGEEEGEGSGGGGAGEFICAVLQPPVAALQRRICLALGSIMYSVDSNQPQRNVENNGDGEPRTCMKAPLTSLHKASLLSSDSLESIMEYNGEGDHEMTKLLAAAAVATAEVDEVGTSLSYIIYIVNL